MEASQMSNKEFFQIYSEEGERSLLELLPTAVATQAKAIPAEFFDLTEQQIKKMITWTPTIERLRIAFWMEHERAVRKQETMNMANVYSGLVQWGYFKNKFITNSFNLLYMLTPPVNYDLAMEEALVFGIEQIRDILAAPHIDDNGNINTKVAKLKVELVKELADRRKGKTVSRMQIQTHNTNLELTGGQDQQPDRSVEELEAEVKALEHNMQPTLTTILVDNVEKERVPTDT
jgi:hypothetical protein